MVLATNLRLREAHKYEFMKYYHIIELENHDNHHRKL